MDRAQCGRGDKAYTEAPAPVKPCPGEQRSEQGLSGSPVDDTAITQEYKGYKKRLQENVFTGLIEKINVTLIELSRPVVTLKV